MTAGPFTQKDIGAFHSNPELKCELSETFYQCNQTSVSAELSIVGRLAVILVVNFNLVENALLEKVSNDLGFSERCQYIQEMVTTPQALNGEFKRAGRELPRVIIINLDSADADWKTLLKNLKEDETWRFIPVLGFGFLEDNDTVREFYELGGASCIRKPHGYEGLAEITKRSLVYWLDVSFMPCDFMTDVA